MPVLCWATASAASPGARQRPRILPANRTFQTPLVLTTTTGPIGVEYSKATPSPLNVPEGYDRCRGEGPRTSCRIVDAEACSAVSVAVRPYGIPVMRTATSFRAGSVLIEQLHRFSGYPAELTRLGWLLLRCLREPKDGYDAVESHSSPAQGLTVL